MASINDMFGNQTYSRTDDATRYRPIFLQNIIKDIERQSGKFFYVPETYDTSDEYSKRTAEEYTNTKSEKIDHFPHHSTDWNE